MKRSFVRPFADVTYSDVATAGGKGASLGDMAQAGLPVPPGFVITAAAFERFHDSEIPKPVEREIMIAFDALGAEHVAVRSSATAEDGEAAAWAGQLESYLYTPRAEIFARVREAWNSLSSPRATLYRQEQGLADTPIAVAVVVQKMIVAEVSGVAFTANPITGNRLELMIEAVYGDNEALVGGRITPDNYLLEMSTGTVLSADTAPQPVMFRRGKERPVAANSRAQAKLTPVQLQELAAICRKVAAHFGRPQDIEWVHDGTHFYLVQARPITTLG